MKTATILTALALAAAAPLASARNCKTGLRYCGNTLLRIGKSMQLIGSHTFRCTENTICESRK